MSLNKKGLLGDAADGESEEDLADGASDGGEELWKVRRAYVFAPGDDAGVCLGWSHAEFGKADEDGAGLCDAADSGVAVGALFDDFHTVFKSEFARTRERNELVGVDGVDHHASHRNPVAMRRPVAQALPGFVGSHLDGLAERKGDQGSGTILLGHVATTFDGVQM